MKMDNTERFLIGLMCFWVLALAFTVGVGVGIFFTEFEYQLNLSTYGCATFDSQTGKWGWIERK